MLKKPLKYCSFKTYILLFTVYCSLFTVLSCAPKAAPPPMYKDINLSLEEVITIAQRDINVLKTVAGINIEKNDKPYSYVDALILLKKPGWLHIRLYKFGIMVGNYLIKEDAVYIISGKEGSKFREFGKELYSSIFWWEGLENASMYKEDTEYIIMAKNKEIRLNKATLLPKNQEIIVNSRKISILYDKPVEKVFSVPEEQHQSGFWYPSEVKIESGAYKFTVTVEKLYINPVLGENDFNSLGKE